MRTKPRENNEGQQGLRKREGVRTRERRGKGGHKKTREEREGRERGRVSIVIKICNQLPFNIVL